MRGWLKKAFHLKLTPHAWPPTPHRHRTMKKTVITLSLLLASTSAFAQSVLTEAQKQEVQKVIRETLTNDPKIIVDALQKFQLDQQAKETAQRQKAIEALPGKLAGQKHLASIGNPKASVTVVEFYDYNCGYCRRMAPVIQDVIGADKDLRWVFVDFPILVPTSRTAALAAMAAGEQGKFKEFHFALMSHNGPVNEDAIDAVAKKVGLDVAKLKKDMQDPALETELRKNLQLGAELGIQGTPSFVIGKEFVGGAVDKDQLLKMIDMTRNKTGQE